MKILLSISLPLIFTFSYDVSACSCAIRTLTEKYEAAHYVFRGTITNIEATEIAQKGVTVQKLNFNMHEALKGSYVKTYFYKDEPVYTYCGVDMEPNTKYVVFLNAQGYMSSCSGTFIMNSALSLLKHGEIKALHSKQSAQNKASNPTP